MLDETKSLIVTIARKLPLLGLLLLLLLPFFENFKNGFHFDFESLIVFATNGTHCCDRLCLFWCCLWLGLGFLGNWRFPCWSRPHECCRIPKTLDQNCFNGRWPVQLGKHLPGLSPSGKGRTSIHDHLGIPLGLSPNRNSRRGWAPTGIRV